MLLRSNLKKRKKKLRREKGTEKRGGEIVGSTHSRKVVLIQIDSSPPHHPPHPPGLPVHPTKALSKNRGQPREHEIRSIVRARTRSSEGQERRVVHRLRTPHQLIWHGQTGPDYVTCSWLGFLARGVSTTGIGTSIGLSMSLHTCNSIRVRHVCAARRGVMGMDATQR